MDTYPCVPHMLEGNIYQVLDTQFLLPRQQQQQPQSLGQNNSMLQAFHNQNPLLNASAAMTNMVHQASVNEHLQMSSAGNPPTDNAMFVVNNNCYVQQPSTNANSDLCNDAGLTNNYSGEVHILSTGVQNAKTPKTDHLNVSVPGMNKNSNDFKLGYQTLKPPQAHMKVIMKIPEPTQVKVNPNQREKIGGLKIQVSGSFLSWNASGRTILDLNFMRNLFYITNVDIVFQSDLPYEKGVCEGLDKLVQNKLFSDWLVLKCEEKQIPFFKVNNQVEMYTVNNFSTLLTIIAQESCLPLPFITRDKRNMRYFYINFPKSSNNRVKKLNVPIFHDADNGRKKIPCKHPGVRLDCTFVGAIQRFVIHVHKSASEAITEYVSYIRQVIIYNHIVWGFLQAWTRRVREQYNGCFKAEEIAQNLSLCQGDLSQTGKTLSDEHELTYYIGYLNFYLKFDPVALRDTTINFTIENFETNLVSDVSIVQYYRQFFLINDMHYSDALKNIVLFAEENGASNVTDFVYMPPKDDNVVRTNAGFFPPGGISRPSVQQQKAPNKKQNAPGGLDLHSTKPMTLHPTTQTHLSSSVARETRPSNVNGALNNNKMTNPTERVSQGVNIHPNSNAVLSKPLIKTRTVEEINSSVELKRGSDASRVSFDSILSDQRKVNWVKQGNPVLPSCVREVLHHCFVRNVSEICTRDASTDPAVMQKLFNDALNQAKEMTTIETFIEKLYVTLQKSFTNSTSQNIMNRTICRALEMRFPNLKPRLSGQDRSGPPTNTGEARAMSKSPQKIKKTSVCPAGEHVKTSLPNGTAKMSSVKENKNLSNEPKVMAATLRKATENPPKPGSLAKRKEASREASPPNKHTHILTTTQQTAQEEALTVRNAVIPPKSSPASPTDSNLQQHSLLKETQRDNAEESGCSINSNINRKEQERNETKTSAEKVDTSPLSVKTPVRDYGNLGNGNTRAVENGKNISIQLMLSVTNTTDETSLTMQSLMPTSQPCPESELDGPIESSESHQQHQSSSNQTVEEQEQSMETDKSGFSYSEVKRESLKSTIKEKDLYARYNLKPCSVLLNRNDVLVYQKSQERLRKRQRQAVYTTSIAFSDDSSEESDDDSNDNDFVVPEPRCRKKSKRISEIQYMEARTRVLQRLRKRNQMYVPNSDGQQIYTSEELDQFLIRNPQSSLTSIGPDAEVCEMEEPEKVAAEEDEKYRTLYRECLTRKVNVVLVRIKDTNKCHEEMYNWRVKTKEDGRLTLTRNSLITEYENIPRNRRRYFEVKDGKLYLKKQYHVVNGKIVLIHAETIPNRIRLKNEPPSLQDESNFPVSRIKEEVLPE